MGARSRERRRRRAWVVTLALPLAAWLAAWARRLPPRAAWRLATALGRLFGATRATQAVVRRNLAVACGRRPPGRTLRRFEAAYHEHVGGLLLDFLRQPLLTRATLARHLEPTDDLARAQAVYAQSKAAGRGVIFVAGHAGLWELAGHLAGLVGIPITSVAKLTDHPGLDAFVLGIRQSGGQRVIDVRGSMWAMKKALDRGEAVGINVDQEARTDPVFAPFFGVPAATSAAPALLHRRTKAPIVVTTVLRTGPFRYRLRVFDVIRPEDAPGPDEEQAALVARVTARINRAMEAAIREAPAQWLWSHRRWRRRPPGEPWPFARVDDAPPLELTRARLGFASTRP